MRESSPSIYARPSKDELMEHFAALGPSSGTRTPSNTNPSASSARGSTSPMTSSAPAADAAEGWRYPAAAGSGSIRSTRWLRQAGGSNGLPK